VLKYLIEMNLPENYIPVLIQAAVGLGFVLLSILGTHFLGPKNSSKRKTKISNVVTR
jgi:NADH-quinone oxidoreductase subunit A